MDCLEDCYIDTDALKSKRRKMTQSSMGVSLQDLSFKIT